MFGMSVDSTPALSHSAQRTPRFPTSLSETAISALQSRDGSRPKSFALGDGATVFLGEQSLFQSANPSPKRHSFSGGVLPHNNAPKQPDQLPTIWDTTPDQPIRVPPRKEWVPIASHPAAKDSKRWMTKLKVLKSVLPRAFSFDDLKKPRRPTTEGTGSKRASAFDFRRASDQPMSFSFYRRPTSHTRATSTSAEPVSTWRKVSFDVKTDVGSTFEFTPEPSFSKPGSSVPSSPQILPETCVTPATPVLTHHPTPLFEPTITKTEPHTSPSAQSSSSSSSSSSSNPPNLLMEVTPPPRTDSSVFVFEPKARATFTLDSDIELHDSDSEEFSPTYSPVDTNFSPVSIYTPYSTQSLPEAAMHQGVYTIEEIEVAGKPLQAAGGVGKKRRRVRPDGGVDPMFSNRYILSPEGQWVLEQRDVNGRVIGHEVIDSRLI
ncbi:hypothetical protein BJ742DRAFT_517220 [Cladochytrium replicatum]|nr:hypothetical protein BJ742DRAFT_517220 [Cladochytrium replicatum]